MNRIVLITGGVKSGKSAWALTHGEELGARRGFIATATALDGEMQKKIDLHQEERGARWQTIEEPRDLPGQLVAADREYDVVLVDCLTLWVSNLLTLYELSEDAVSEAFGDLTSVLAECRSTIIFVTNEVGMGIMPMERISRRYQNMLGRLNKEIAALADSVYFMVSGIATKIK